jgi:hypothetical protein
MNGISIGLRMEPVAPRAGDNVHFSITATDASASCCLTTFYLGDGTFVPADPSVRSCPFPVPGAYAGQVDHVYSKAGTFTVMVQPSSFDFCSPGAVPINAQLYVTVVVAPAG